MLTILHKLRFLFLSFFFHWGGGGGVGVVVVGFGYYFYTEKWVLSEVYVLKLTEVNIQYLKL